MVLKTKKKTSLTSSMEDYLETVAVLKADNGVVRVRDISKVMGVKKPSVTGALKALSERGLIVHERYGYVDLTPEGEKVARSICKKHDMLVRFLNRILGVDKKISVVDACEMEHFMSPQTFDRLTKFVEYVKGCPEGGRPEWLKGFEHYYKTGKRIKCKVKKG
ncbi:MAG: metal-dependent transcriptional regulator [Candidatus Omnitrophota bacterium]